MKQYRTDEIASNKWGTIQVKLKIITWNMTKLRQKLSPVHFISRASNKKLPASMHSYLPRNKNYGYLRKIINRLWCLKEADILFGHFFFTSLASWNCWHTYYIMRIRYYSSRWFFSLTSVSIFRLIVMEQTNLFRGPLFSQKQINWINAETSSEKIGDGTV